MTSGRNNLQCSSLVSLTRSSKLRSLISGWSLMRFWEPVRDVELLNLLMMPLVLIVSRKRWEETQESSTTLSSNLENSTPNYAGKQDRTSAPLLQHTLFFATSCKSRIDTMEIYSLILKAISCILILASSFQMLQVRELSSKKHHSNWQLRWLKYSVVTEVDCLTSIVSLWRKDSSHYKKTLRKSLSLSRWCSWVKTI